MAAPARHDLRVYEQDNFDFGTLHAWRYPSHDAPVEAVVLHFEAGPFKDDVIIVTEREWLLSQLGAESRT